jgi:hypothetical protein
VCILFTPFTYMSGGIFFLLFRIIRMVAECSNLMIIFLFRSCAHPFDPFRGGWEVKSQVVPYRSGGSGRLLLYLTRRTSSMLQIIDKLTSVSIDIHAWLFQYLFFCITFMLQFYFNQLKTKPRLT